MPDTQTLILVCVAAALVLWVYNRVRRLFRSVGSVGFLAAVAVAVWYLWTQLHLALPTGVHAPRVALPTLHGVAVPWWLIAGVLVAGGVYLFTRFAHAHHSQPDDASHKPARVNANNTPDNDSTRDDR
jgi:hypothetical protein